MKTSQDDSINKGLVLAAKYALPPNTKGYCGGCEYTRKYADFFNGKLQINELETELKKFKAHYAYLKLTARENDLEPFDLDVVRAFWIGNELLENVSYEALQKFIKEELFLSQPQEKKRAEMLAYELPKGIVPHHSFNSLYINFVSEAVGRTIENYDACCINIGRVKGQEEKTGKVRVTRTSIVESKDTKTEQKIRQKFEVKNIEDQVSLEKDGFEFIEKRFQQGDLVSIHWGMIIEKISEEDAKNITKYTEKNVEAIRRDREMKDKKY